MGLGYAFPVKRRPDGQAFHGFAAFHAGAGMHDNGFRGRSVAALTPVLRLEEFPAGTALGDLSLLRFPAVAFGAAVIRDFGSELVAVGAHMPPVVRGIAVELFAAAAAFVQRSGGVISGVPAGSAHIPGDGIHLDSGNGLGLSRGASRYAIHYTGLRTLVQGFLRRFLGTL